MEPENTELSNIGWTPSAEDSYRIDRGPKPETLDALYRLHESF